MCFVLSFVVYIKNNTVIIRYLTAECRLICNVVPCLQVTICRTGSGDLSCLKQPEVNVNTGVSIVAFCRLTLSERLDWY